MDANAEEEDLILSTMPLLVPLLLSRKKRVRSTTLFTTESTFDLLILNAVDVVIVVIV